MTISKGKDFYSSDSRKTFIILMLCLFCILVQILWIFFSHFFLPFPPRSVVVVDFIDTMKSN